LATPDAKFYEVIIDDKQQQQQQKRRGRHIRDGEFKSPWSRDAFKEVPNEYMAQLQVTMEVDCVDEDDFSSLRVEDDTGHSEWVVVRVKVSFAKILAFCKILNFHSAPRNIGPRRSRCWRRSRARC